MTKGTTPQAGERHGMLTCTGRFEYDAHKKRIYEFVCDCGSKGFRDANIVRRGRSRSCGCARRKVNVAPPYLWTSKCDHKLRVLAEQDISVSDIARTFGARYNDTVARMKLLELPINWGRPAPLKECYPPGLRFEDRPNADSDRRKSYVPSINRASYGCAAGMCLE